MKTLLKKTVWRLKWIKIATCWLDIWLKNWEKIDYKLTKNWIKNWLEASVKTLLNEKALPLCCLKNKTWKKKRTQFKIMSNICCQLD